MLLFSFNIAQIEIIHIKWAVSGNEIGRVSDTRQTWQTLIASVPLPLHPHSLH